MKKQFHRETKWLKYSNGVEFPILVSPGQRINPRKAYKRYLKQLEEEKNKI